LRERTSVGCTFLLPLAARDARYRQKSVEDRDSVVLFYNVPVAVLRRVVEGNGSKVWSGALRETTSGSLLLGRRLLAQRNSKI